MTVGIEKQSDGWRVIDCTDPVIKVYGFKLTEHQAYEIAEKINRERGIKGVTVIQTKKKNRAGRITFGWKKPKKKKEVRIRKVKWLKNPRCHYCKIILAWSETTLDHVHPRSKGGPTSALNTVLSCGPCNVKKGDKVLTENQ